MLYTTIPAYADTKIAALDVDSLERMSLNADADVLSAAQLISALDREKTSEKIVSPVSGKVKYINTDDYESDVLLRISLDGKMKIVFTVPAENEGVDRGALLTAKNVQIRTEDSKEYKGTIISHDGNTYTATVNDESLLPGAAVGVYTDDTLLGNGTVEINSEYVVTGTRDNISEYSVKINDTVYLNTTLAKLKSSVPTDRYAEALRNYNAAKEKQNELRALEKDPYLYAGIAGIVTELYIENNSILSGTSDKALAARISPSQPNVFIATVPEQSISHVKIGMTAELTLTANSDQVIKATVSFINPVGIVSNGSTTYEVHFRVDDTKKLMIGMTGTIVLVVEKAEQCVVLPIELVHERDGGTFYVLVPSVDSSAYAEQEIEIGISNEDYVQIISGISEGDTVLYTGTLSIQR